MSDKSEPPKRYQQRPGFFASLTRSQVAAAVASAVDFVVLLVSVEFLAIWYVAGTAIGAFVGAATNFFLGRHWSFRASSGAMRAQALRYALVSLGSLLLNTLGVFVLTDWGDFPYPVSKITVSVLVGLLFNFPLHRVFVFR